MNPGGSPTKATQATLKTSIEPTVSLWLQHGSGPLCISGEHLIAVKEEAESEGEEEDVNLEIISQNK